MMTIRAPTLALTAPRAHGKDPRHRNPVAGVFGCSQRLLAGNDLEVDNSGKMTAKQMEAKWKRYSGVDGFILVVAVTEARMQRLRRGAELVKDIALFTTFDRLRKVAEPLIDFWGITTPV